MSWELERLAQATCALRDAVRGDLTAAEVFLALDELSGDYAEVGLAAMKCISAEVQGVGVCTWTGPSNDVLITRIRVERPQGIDVCVTVGIQRVFFAPAAMLDRTLPLLRVHPGLYVTIELRAAEQEADVLGNVVLTGVHLR